MSISEEYGAFKFIYLLSSSNHADKANIIKSTMVIHFNN